MNEKNLSESLHISHIIIILTYNERIYAKYILIINSSLY